jgi:hypothetical protein
VCLSSLCVSFVSFLPFHLIFLFGHFEMRAQITGTRGSISMSLFGDEAPVCTNAAFAFAPAFSSSASASDDGWRSLLLSVAIDHVCAASAAIGSSSTSSALDAPTLAAARRWARASCSSISNSFPSSSFSSSSSSALDALTATAQQCDLALRRYYRDRQDAFWQRPATWGEHTGGGGGGGGGGGRR